jgi:AhpD family alkylhydroperoxidase
MMQSAPHTVDVDQAAQGADKPGRGPETSQPATGHNHVLRARIGNPAVTVQGAMQALQALSTAAGRSSLPKATTDLVHLRASQINGCAVCLDMHSRGAKKAGETDERLATVAAWRESPYFTPAERAALALTEVVTRLSDRADPVPDEIWDEAARHYDEPALASLVIQIALINTWNRLNVTTRQIAGAWTSEWAG